MLWDLLGLFSQYYDMLHPEDFSHVECVVHMHNFPSWLCRRVLTAAHVFQQELQMHLDRLRAAADLSSAPSSRAQTPGQAGHGTRQRRGMKTQARVEVDVEEKGPKSSSPASKHRGKQPRQAGDRSELSQTGCAALYLGHGVQWSPCMNETNAIANASPPSCS